jgi:baculoviral IAP repeat-containing protein 2/3
MRFESQRLATFISWPATAKVGASKIAKAGFYYTGSYLEVKCKWCGCCIGSWEFGDQVMMRHRTAKPDCPFVLNISDNVPLAPSPQITPQTSQVDSSQSTVDTTGTDRGLYSQHLNTGTQNLDHSMNRTIFLSGI